MDYSMDNGQWKMDYGIGMDNGLLNISESECIIPGPEVERIRLQGRRGFVRSPTVPQAKHFRDDEVAPKNACSPLPHSSFSFFFPSSSSITSPTSKLAPVPGSAPAYGPAPPPASGPAPPPASACTTWCARLPRVRSKIRRLGKFPFPTCIIVRLSAGGPTTPAPGPGCPSASTCTSVKHRLGKVVYPYSVPN